MNREDIIRMARESRMFRILDEHASEYGNGTFENTLCPELERFAALVAAAERETFCATLRQLHDAFSLKSEVFSLRARSDK